MRATRQVMIDSLGTVFSLGDTISSGVILRDYTTDGKVVFVEIGEQGALVKRRAEDYGLRLAEVPL